MTSILQLSEETDKVLEALFKVQSEASGPAKTAYNPFHKSKYADLASVVQAIHDPMLAAGLLHTTAHSVVLDQQDNPAFREDWAPKTNKEQGGVQPPPKIFVCWVLVETTIFHRSGQYIRSQTKLRSVDSTAQAIGSCITYGRRYNLLSLMGLAPEDDDANTGSGRVTPKQQVPKPQKNQFAPKNTQFAPSNKQIRSHLNQDLTKKTTKEGFNQVHEKFVGQYGEAFVNCLTEHRPGETYRMVFSDHWERIKNLTTPQKTPEEPAKNPEADEYAAWEASLNTCTTKKTFKVLEKQYIDNTSWENDAAEKLINEVGKKLGVQGY